MVSRCFYAAEYPPLLKVIQVLLTSRPAADNRWWRCWTGMTGSSAFAQHMPSSRSLSVWNKRNGFVTFHAANHLSPHVANQKVFTSSFPFQYFHIHLSAGRWSSGTCLPLDSILKHCPSPDAASIERITPDSSILVPYTVPSRSASR